jgi:hypothetical protein
MLLFTRYHIPEEHTLNIYCCENSCINIDVSLLLIILDSVVVILFILLTGVCNVVGVLGYVTVLSDIEVTLF